MSNINLIRITLLAAFVSTSVWSAQSTQPTTQPQASPPAGDPNPPAEGFNIAESDQKAMIFADLTMQAMGGRRAWDETRYITWNFFGQRRHVWDKHTGNIRAEFGNPEGNGLIVILMNIHTRLGRVWISGEEVVEPERREPFLRTGYGSWVNDGYWMFMPYKLKDSGVTLTYKGNDKTEDGRDADVVTLTFHEIGLTPENKYDVYIVREDRLVGQWAFYRNAADEDPRFTSPWNNWQKFGKIMLSDDRGGPDRKHTDIAVFDELPESVFTDPEPIDFEAMIAAAKQSK